MKTRHFVSLIVAAGLALAGPLPALAMPPGGMAMMPGPDTPPPMVAPMAPPVVSFLHDLDLAEAQQDKLFELNHAQEPQRRAKMKELRKAQDALREMSSSGEFDDAKAKSLTETIGRATAELTLMQARFDGAVYRLLTPEQRQRWNDRAECAGEPGARRGPQGPEAQGRQPRGRYERPTEPRR